MSTPTLSEVSADTFFDAINLPAKNADPDIAGLVAELQGHLEQSLELFDAMLATIPERFHTYPCSSNYRGSGYEDVDYCLHSQAHDLYKNILKVKPTCFERVRHHLVKHFERRYGFAFGENVTAEEVCDGYAQRVVDFILDSLPVPLAQMGVDQLLAEGNHTFAGGRQPPELKNTTIKFFSRFYLESYPIGEPKLSWDTEGTLQLLFRMVYYFINSQLKPHDLGYPELRQMVGRGHSFYSLTLDTFQNANGILHFQSSIEAERFYGLFQLGQKLRDA